jgi:filamentous hemagglutinin family protein
MKMMKIFKITYIFILYLTFAINVIANDEVGKLDLPTGANIVSGNVTIEKNTGKLIINQTSNQAIIEWQKFNVGANASVYFNHLNSPYSVSSILNQIVAGGKSIINGNIYSNGKLFINNPNGITIGTNSNISAYSFIGSAMKIANQDFLNHNYHYKQDRQSLFEQNGEIDARYVALLATDVTNNGTIRSKNGSVNLSASDDMVLKINSDNSLQIKVNPSKLKATVSNKGIVIAENGAVSMKADMAEDAIAETIKSPENKANRLVSKNGVIKLVSNSGLIKGKKVTLDAGNNGAVENSGKIDTSSSTSKGGSVEIKGKEVIIKAGSEIKSTGIKQGGNIYVGKPNIITSVAENFSSVTNSTFVTIENNTILDVSSLKDSAGIVKITSSTNNSSGNSRNGSMTSVNGVILARTGSSRREDLAKVSINGDNINLNQIYIDVSSKNDIGGDINIESSNDIVGGEINLISNGKFEGGDINVVSLFGDVNLQHSLVQTNSSAGRGGTININSLQNIILIDANINARGSPEGGNITIKSTENDVNLQASIIQTNGSTGRGGTIELSGFNHTIIQSSSFYSKGSNKGGNIYIGNNFYEKSIPFSKYTYIDPYSIIDATSSNFGGFVETSGQILELLSKINVGYEGLWLIDPYDVTIASSGATGTGYSSTFTPSQTTVILASSIINSLNAGTSVSITTGSATSNTLTVNAAIAKTSGSSATLTLTGGFIDINSDISSSSDALNLTLNAATMDITSNLSLNGGDLTINNSSDSTFSGVFSGSENSRLLKNGAGILTLSGTNTYSGSTYLYNGTLIISSDANLGTAPAEATASHLILQGGRLKTTTTMTLNSNRGMHLNTSWSYLEVADTTTLTYDGIITGTSTSYDLVLNYSGTTGTLVLGGTSTYVGSTKIYDGTLSISDELNLGPTSCNNTDCIDLYNAGVLQITDDVTFGSNQGIKIANSDNTKILIATGKTLTLNHEFYNNGGGAYVLTINDGSHDGKLHMTTSAVAPSNSAYFGFTDSTNGGFVVANGTLQLDDYRNLTYDSSYTSYLTMASGSTLILNETNQQQQLDLILQGATVELLQSQTWTGDVTLSGTNTFNVADGKTWTTSSGSWNNASGQTGAITKTGTGTLVLGNSTSTWTGLTTVTAGTLRTNTNNALGTSAGGVQVNGGVLDVRNTLADEITLNGGTLYGYGGTISSTITLSQNSTIEAGSTTTITGVITDGDNSYSVTKTGNGYFIYRVQAVTLTMAAPLLPLVKLKCVIIMITLVPVQSLLTMVQD